MLEAARAAHLRPTVVTFDPHPRAFFGQPVQLLSTLERRLELLEAAGIEDVLVLHFDDALAALDPAVVRRDDPARDRRRGRGGRRRASASGATGRATSACSSSSASTCGAVPLVDNVSSSHVRKLLAAGDVARAATLLGRPPEVEGIVVMGDQRGRLLGFPTANLETPPELLVPALGIYAGATLGHRTAISIGTNPHYHGTERRVEGHLLDFDGDLYGQRLVFELWQRLRDEAAFGSEAELIAAIDHDVAQTREAVRPV